MTWRIAEIVWAGAILVGLPITSRSLGRRLREESFERMDVYASAVLSHVILVVPTLLIDLAGDRAGIHLLTRWLPFPTLLFWILGTIAACVAVWAAMLLEAKARPQISDKVVLDLLPRNRKELTAFFGVSFAAGFAEEYLLRGFCLGLLAMASGSMALAFVVTTLSFGLAHLYQGIRGALRATVLGGILAAPVVATGCLLPSMIAHAAVDIISGRWTLEILRSWSISTQ